ncbi:IPT/TIG domain-containing protein [Chitinophaga arvensicola]|uniref:IPT/TIG domain-containing protein n=1 Tax=Chitinophaga arvensicola TaxID=29529 RepID=A0A1I0P443_9BACT|nr:IPT/TIG domain-containing protein [Chitinophaga arvensicola]SEW08944.1 IPT/TIG domain-containing protein [Chitinophaga arvensicola]
MTHFKLFVTALMLLITAMTACSPNPTENTAEVVTVEGHAGNFLMIKGHGFSEDRHLNKVSFGNVPAQILRANANYLLVQVPVQKAATVPVVVAVGDNVSNAMLFAYHPKLVAAK